MILDKSYRDLCFPITLRRADYCTLRLVQNLHKTVFKSFCFSVSHDVVMLWCWGVDWPFVQFTVTQIHFCPWRISCLVIDRWLASRLLYFINFSLDMHAAVVHMSTFIYYYIAPFFFLELDRTQLSACMNWKEKKINKHNNKSLYVTFGYIILHVATFYEHYKAINEYSYSTIHIKPELIQYTR